MTAENPSGGNPSGREGVKRQIQLPLNVVVGITMNGIKIRLWRSLVTASGIMLSIAFFSYVLTNLWTTPNQSSDEQARQVWLVIMSVLVTAVGITNSMMMSVTERFREIGTMKCLGALDSFVVALFFIEAGFMGFLASLAGWLVGFATAIIGHLFGLGWHTTWMLVTPIIFGRVTGLSIALGIIMTMIATILPAVQAAQMPAAAALRTQI